MSIVVGFKPLMNYGGARLAPPNACISDATYYLPTSTTGGFSTVKTGPTGDPPVTSFATDLSSLSVDGSSRMVYLSPPTTDDNGVPSQPGS